MSARASGARPTRATIAPHAPHRITHELTGGPPEGQCFSARGLTVASRHGKLWAVPVDSEFLVIGSGIAGLTCALECARVGRVVLLAKDRLPESSSQYAQGGIASVWSPEDSFEAHIADTMAAGDGLCRRAAVETVVREGPDRVRDLIE